MTMERPIRRSSSSTSRRSHSAGLSQSYYSFESGLDEDGKDNSNSSSGDELTEEAKRSRHQSVPRRPHTAPRKGHVHRGTLGLSSNETLPSKQEIFMTHLPDSPPRNYFPSPSNERLATARSPRVIRVIHRDLTEAKSIFNFSTEEHTIEEKENSTVILEGAFEEGLESLGENEPQDCSAQENHMEQNTVCDVTNEYDPLDRREGELNSSTWLEKEPILSEGPSVTTILSIPMIESKSFQVNHGEERPEVDSDEQEYQALQSARRQLEEQEARRETARRELESYMSFLTNRHDENGDKWIEFPQNYHQIVSLMTERDVREEQEEKKSTKSWSQILIQNSLSQQQAYGALDGGEENGDGENGLAAKIALKMARIRQLDAVLEEKLGKNLYGTTATKKTKPQRAKSSLNPENQSSKSIKPEPSIHRSIDEKGNVNHVERNRKLIENGAKANLTREEEVRLSRLLQADTIQVSVDQQVPQPQDGSVEITTIKPVVREFALEDQVKQEIEQLLAQAQLSLLPALDGIEEEEEGNDEGIQSLNKEKPKLSTKSAPPFNERLNKRRLHQIDEELQFLREHEEVPILPDDDDTLSDDGCRTERSYMTTTSMGSTCSTRSGVTRRQLDLYIAMEMKKPENRSGSKLASTDAIQSLLRSLSHVSISRPTTTV